jgi:hypothetical protein
LAESDLLSVFALRKSKCLKKSKKTVENEKILKKYKKFFKRVLPKTFLCGKLWEKLK